eukprot:1402308-Amphidinium_carterae.1
MSRCLHASPFPMFSWKSCNGLNLLKCNLVVINATLFGPVSKVNGTLIDGNLNMMALMPFSSMALSLIAFSVLALPHPGVQLLAAQSAKGLHASATPPLSSSGPLPVDPKIRSTQPSTPQGLVIHHRSSKERRYRLVRSPHRFLKRPSLPNTQYSSEMHC